MLIDKKELAEKSLDKRSEVLKDIKDNFNSLADIGMKRFHKSQKSIKAK